MNDKSFEIDRLYYRFGYGQYTGNAGACVETLRYKGIVALGHTSSQCDTPYQFYHFEQVSFGESYGSLNIPSLRQAQQSVLTCGELIEYLRDHERTEIVDGEARRIKKELELLPESQRAAHIVDSIEQLRSSGTVEDLLTAIERVVCPRPS